MVQECTVGCFYNMKKEYKNHVILYLKIRNLCLVKIFLNICIEAEEKIKEKV